MWPQFEAIPSCDLPRATARGGETKSAYAPVRVEAC
jgi:hypothetical protein